MSKDLRNSLHETAHILHDTQSAIQASGFDFESFEQRAFEIEGMASRLQDDLSRAILKGLKE